MQEKSVLRELTNIHHNKVSPTNKNTRRYSSDSSEDSEPELQLHSLLKISTELLDFGLCLPGSVHQRTFQVQILKNLHQMLPLKLFIVNQDEELSKDDHLVFGVTQESEKQYFEDYYVDVCKKEVHKFKIGVKTPSVGTNRTVKSYLGIQLGEHSPQITVLQQEIRTPQIEALQELVSPSGRVIKLSLVEGKGKKQCRIAFRLDTHINLSMMAEIIGIEPETIPLISVKPKLMTLTGQGPFTLVLCMGINSHILQAISKGQKYQVRRILLLREKQTKLIYHFPLEVTYFPRCAANGE